MPENTLRPWGRPVRRLALWCVVGLLVALVVPLVGSPRPAAAAGTNAIVTENQQPGSSAWQFDSNPVNGNPLKAENHEIEGYASKTSVNKGETIDFKVSLSSNAQYTAQVYRMGYYPTGKNADGTNCAAATGCGGRLMQSVGPLTGTKQATCPTTTTTVNFGLTECSWTTGFTLAAPASWTTGNYIVKLQRTDTKLESYMTFVLRDDAAPADIVLSMDVTTWQAYNFWGGSGNKNIGYNLYGQFNDVTYDNTGQTRARAVSFNRPYTVQGAQDGAGNFMVWDYPMVRWLEKSGYNVTYATNLDMENNPNLMQGRKAFINTGHDEYYSDNMRANLQSYINGGAHMGFFSANNIYYRIRFASSSSGEAQRTIVCYKDATDPDPADTLRWRDLTPPKPENAIGGVIQNGVATNRAFRVFDASSWIFAGTGLVNFVSGNPVTSGTGQNAIAGLVGYEFDERAANDPSLSAFTSHEPPGLQQVGHSAVPATDNGVNAFSDATLYTAGSGAIVFSAGTLQWSWGLDNGEANNTANGYCDCNPGFANAKSQQITANILNRFITTQTTPAAVTLNPTGVTFPSQALNSTSPAQSVTLTNSGGAPLTISGVAVTGTNAADFAQTNTCPLTPTTLAPGATCSISTTFSPGAAGARSATLAVTDNAGGSPHSVALSGTGASAPALSLTPTSLAFPNEQIGASSPAQQVTVTNSGSAPLTLSSIGLAGTNPADFGETTTCALAPATIPAGGSCTVAVAFTPTATGPRTGTLSIASDAAGSPHAVTLNGTGTSTPVPAAQVGPSSLTFASQTVNTTSAAQPVTVGNTGNAPLSISQIALAGANAGDFAQTTTCPIAPASLAPGATCAVNVTFRPTVVGSRTATLSVTDNDPSTSPQSITITGTGAGAGTYLTDGFESGTLSAWTTNRSAGGTAATSTTQVNSGTRSASMANSSSGQYVGLSAPLAGGGQAQTYTRFCFDLANLSGSTPLAQGRDVNGNPLWEVDYDAALKGLDIYFWNGARARTDLFSPANTVLVNKWYCAEVQANQTATGHGEVWLNGTSVARTNTNLSVTNPYSSLFLWNNGPAGTAYVDDVLVSSAYSGPVGAGAAPLPGPGVSLAPSTVSFASQPVNTVSGSQTVTLTNSGSAPLTMTAIGVSGTNAADFAQSSTCPMSPSTLAASGSCAITLTFTPSATGTRTANLSVTDNAPGSPHTVALTGTGAAALAPTVSFTPTTLGFGGQAVNSPSAPQTSTLTNTGSAPLTINGLTVTGTNSGDFVQTSDCPIAPATLAANATCLVSVTFTPSSGGSRTAAVSVADNAPGSPHTLALTGTGTLPNGTYLMDGFENGLASWTKAGNGTQTTSTATANSGTTALAMTNATNGQYGGVSASLAGGGQAQTYSRFCFSLVGVSGTTVLAQGRDANGNLMWEVDYDNGSKGLDIYVWNGARARTNMFTAANLLVPNRWYCAEVQVNEVTAGHAEVWLNGASVASANANLSATNPYSRLHLWNNGATGTVYADDVRVSGTYNGPVGAAGTAPAPVATVSPGSLTFASQATGTTSAAQTVTVRNDGTAPLAISGIALAGTNAADYAQTNTCGTSVAVGASCAVSVRFTPGAPGSRTASLTVTDNAPGSPHTVTLAGTGSAPASAPAVQLSPSSLAFGSSTVGTTSAAQSVTLTNTGTAPLTISSITLAGTDAAQFTRSTSCPSAPATLAAGASCSTSVTFTPGAAGAAAASLTVSDNAAGSPHAVPLTGTGTLPTGSFLADGFESGLGGWGLIGNGTAAVSSTTTNSGPSAATLTNAAGQYAGLAADLAAGPQAQTYTRFCFNLANVSGSTVLAQGRDVNGAPLWEIDYDAGSKGLDVYFWNGARVRSDVYSPANLIVPDRWYCAELQADQRAAGHGEVWLNGTSVGSVDGDLSAANPYSRLYLWNNGATGTVYSDDVRVATTYGGPVGRAVTP